MNVSFFFSPFDQRHSRVCLSKRVQKYNFFSSPQAFCKLFSKFIFSLTSLKILVLLESLNSGRAKVKPFSHLRKSFFLKF